MITNVPFYQPDIGAAEIEEVVATLKSGWLTTGPRVAPFVIFGARTRIGAPASPAGHPVRA